MDVRTEPEVSPHKPILSSKVPRRVKVYLLQGEDWIDNGTGYCTGDVDQETRKPFFIVRNELDADDLILKSYLEGSIQYQRQQETLIVWTDLLGKDLALSFQETEGCAELCEFIIKVQQEHYSPEISLYYVIPNTGVSESDGAQSTGAQDITELITGPITYPEDPTTENLEQVMEVINQGSNSQFTRLSILAFVVKTNYLSKLVDAFSASEEKHKLVNLYTLTEIVKALILYNETTLLEDFLATEEKILGLVGILEYDPEYPNLKACHRDFLCDKSKFKVVIDIPGSDFSSSCNITNEDESTSSNGHNNVATNNDNDGLKPNIFRRDFLLNFLKNVVLARFLDDQMFNSLNSLIYFNQVEIINFLKDSSKNNGFLEKLFALYDNDSDASMDTKRDGVKMLHQYVLIAKSLQSYQKTDFFATLVKTGLFRMISFALEDCDSNTRVLGTELIVIIIEQDVSLVNSIDSEESIIHGNATENGNIAIDKDETLIEAKQSKLKLSDDMTLITILAKLLLEDKNAGLKMQAFEALRILLDSNIALNADLTDRGAPLSVGVGGVNEFELEHFKHEVDKSEHHEGDRHLTEDGAVNTNHYFQAFYSQVAPILFQDFIMLAQREPSQELVNRIQNDEILCQHLCEIISFCCREHETHISRPFFLNNDVLSGIGKLLALDVKVTLKLSVIRCLKGIVLINDNSYCQYIIGHGIVKSFFQFFETVMDQNNLANSACLDFLEIIVKNCDKTINHGRRHSFKLLATHIYDNYGELYRNKIGYVSTGRELVRMVENNFYDKPVSDAVKHDTSFESDSEPILNGTADASTPINEEPGVEEDESTSTPRPSDIFQSIENDMANSAKRQREEEIMPPEAEKATELVHEEKKSRVYQDEGEKGKKRSSLKSKLSSASKKLGLGLRAKSANGGSNGGTNGSVHQ